MSSSRNVIKKITDDKLVYVGDLDADGVFFNAAYCADRERNPDGDEKLRLDKTNKVLIDHCRKRAVELNAAVKKLALASARQSKRVDQFNCNINGTGSAFTAIENLAEILDFSHEAYLLTEVYGQDEWIYDDSKFSILYVHMHKLASEKPGAKIVRDFFDDRDDILLGLQNFFSRNTVLIPRNVELNLHYCDGKNLEYRCSIAGRGKIDRNYERTIRCFVEHIGIDLANPASYRLPYHFINELGRHRRAFSHLRELDQWFELYGQFDLSQVVEMSAVTDEKSRFWNAVECLESQLARDISAMPEEERLSSIQAKIAIELEILTHILIEKVSDYGCELAQKAISHFQQRCAVLRQQYLFEDISPFAFAAFKPVKIEEVEKQPATESVKTLFSL